MREWKLGAYQLVRRLGEGGMAQVYLARDVRLGRDVAVKVLDRRLADRSGFRERFLREARVAAALDHPNIVQLFDFGEENGVLFLVMPYVSGGSLQDQLSRTPLSMSEVVAYGSQLTDALAYAHKRHLVHRDVKPANILIHSDGRLMLSDFGLAKILDSGAQPAAARNHPDAGTPEYMAPEQIEGRTEARSDLYGLGVVLYLFMTGRLPFTGSSSNAVMEAHLYRLPESPRRLNPEVTPALEMVIMQALAKRPEDRFATASEMGAALMSALVAGDSSPLPFASPISPLPYASLPPIAPSQSHAPMAPMTPMTPTHSGGSGYIVEAQTSASGRRSSDITAGPAPQLDPLLTSLSATLPAPYVSVSESQGDAHYPGHKVFPSHNSGASRGASGPQPLSFPAAQESGPPLTYRAGEVSNSRADQSMDPTQQLSTLRPSAFSISSPAIKQARRAGASPVVQELPRQSNSRVWIAVAILLTLLLGAAILLLRMAQTGTLFSM
ncbi:MAG TPA: protein kinase [Ktedonobacterales bacterium]|nr:protein kinase [Ktedonobacterales bacterium]